MKASTAVAFLALSALSLAASVQAGESVVRVGGYFCDTTENQVAFLSELSAGENDIMAANAVNKLAGRMACADYVSVDVIPNGEKVVMRGGRMFKVYSVIFLPEKVERWTGRLVDSFEISDERHEI